jgi:DNA topoisomerase-3
MRDYALILIAGLQSTGVHMLILCEKPSVAGGPGCEGRICMKDYIYNKKRLIFYVGNYIFHSLFNEVIQAGFKESAPETKEPDEKTRKLIKAEILQKETVPKKEFSPDILLGFMENPYDDDGVKLIGLGTPAARAVIIKTLFDQDYLREKRKKLYATHKGLFLVSPINYSG